MTVNEFHRWIVAPKCYLQYAVLAKKRANRSANVCWGVTKRFSQEYPHIPTTYFLGYDEDEEGNLIINEKEAKTVRRIYRELLAGKGTVLIAKD